MFLLAIRLSWWPSLKMCTSIRRPYWITNILVWPDYAYIFFFLWQSKRGSIERPIKGQTVRVKKLFLFPRLTLPTSAIGLFMFVEATKKEESISQVWDNNIYDLSSPGMNNKWFLPLKATTIIPIPLWRFFFTGEWQWWLANTHMHTHTRMLHVCTHKYIYTQKAYPEESWNRLQSLILACWERTHAVSCLSPSMAMLFPAVSE